jgi:paraquat-inducible protein B
VWVVPFVAAIVAGYLVFDRVRDFGPEITIRFKDGNGVRVGQTPVKYRGVPIGEVTAIELSEDRQRVVVKVRLQRSAASIAQRGSVFWIVRPEVGIADITGLSTVITGPEIQVVPGTGEAVEVFDGLDSAPAALEEKGLKIVLRAPRVGSLRRNSPVYYRGVEVGVVQAADLSANAATVDIQVLIRERYAGLVRSGSAFWNVSGVSVSGGLFSGVHLKMESMRSLAAGGIAFATPGGNGAQAKEGTVFTLNESPKKEWLAWAPRITIPPEK